MHGQQGEDPTEPSGSGKYVYPPVSHEPRMQQLSDAIAKQGLHPFHLPLGLKLNEVDRTLSTCIQGTFFATQAFVQHLMETKSTGKIINLSSVHEELLFPHFAPYCASKGGVKMLTRNLAIELAPLGITINNVAPGAIETSINKTLLNDPVKLSGLLQNIPLGRLGKPGDIASVVSFLASSDADYMTGTTLFADGGLLWNYHEQ